MSALTWLAERLGTAPPPAPKLEQRAASIPPLPIDALGSPFDPPTSDREATAVSAVYAAAQLITSTASRLPLEVYRGDQLAPTQPRLVTKPDPFNPRMFTFSDVFVSLVFRGNAYLRLTQRDSQGTPTVALPLNPDEVHVSWNRNRTRRVYEWRGQRLEAGRDIAHIPLMITPGELLGLSPLGAARRVVNGTRQLDEYRRRFFSDGALPTFILESDEDMDGTEAAEAKAQFVAQHWGKREPAVLGGGLKGHVLGLSPEESQFLESMQFSITDIARFFGVPSSLLEAPPQGGANSIVYQNLATLFDAFLRQGLVNYLERVEAVVTELLPEGDEARFDTRAVLRTDIKTRFEAYAIGINNGFLFPEEARAAEGFGPAPAGSTTPSAAPGSDAPQNAPGERGPGTADLEPSTLAPPDGSRFPDPSGGEPSR